VNPGKAVASFFQPLSQKEPETLRWRIVNRSLIVGKYVTPSQALEVPSTTSTRRKIAAFDLDDTLITAATGNKWAKSATGWKWWDVSVPAKLKNLHNDGYLVVILSNQGNISLKDNPKTLQKDAASLVNFKAQVTAVLRQLDLPISVYAATESDGYRKPRIGMWQEMLEDYDLEREESIDLKQSFYVGDAAGRAKTDKRRKDHACSDR
jgi:bifunctional polynucleotide phosphatase/kinase